LLLRLSLLLLNVLVLSNSRVEDNVKTGLTWDLHRALHVLLVKHGQLLLLKEVRVQTLKLVGGRGDVSELLLKLLLTLGKEHSSQLELFKDVWVHLVVVFVKRGRSEDLLW